MKLLKYLLILLMVFLSIAAILEKLGYTEWLDKDCCVELIKCQNDHNDTIPSFGGHCDDSLRFDTTSVEQGGKQIDLIQYNAMRTAYDNQPPIDPNKFRGTLLSKMAIDKMFDGSPTANVLICRMGLEGVNKTMVYEVGRSENFGIQVSTTGPIMEPPYYFFSTYHCPDMCIDIR